MPHHCPYTVIGSSEKCLRGVRARKQLNWVITLELLPVALEKSNPQTLVVRARVRRAFVAAILSPFKITSGLLIWRLAEYFDCQGVVHNNSKFYPGEIKETWFCTGQCSFITVILTLYTLVKGTNFVDWRIPDILYCSEMCFISFNCIWIVMRNMGIKCCFVNW